MFRTLKSRIKEMQLPRAARSERHADAKGLTRPDPGAERAIAAGAAWLARAQDCSASADGGVARDFSLVRGWATSYPETTGYIVPTMLALADHLGDPAYRDRARRMLDWLASIQLPDGGFQGGRVDMAPVVPVTFNTGQILLGLAAGRISLGDAGDAYDEPMHRAARFLRDSLDDDGCWRRHPTPFAAQGEKAYETHVSWGLLEAERAAPGHGYGEAALRQIEWAIRKQRDNGWVDDCCLSDPRRPLTHTLGYYLKGIVEAHRFSDDSRYLEVAVRLAEGLLGVQRPDGALPGRLHADWRPAVSWSCLTGNVQIADSWYYLYQRTGDSRFSTAGAAANAFVRRTLDMDGREDVRGAVKGSFPVDGGYCTYEYPNWATKFMIDANLTELRQQ